jgi:uncharacterized Zn finger protein
VKAIMRADDSDGLIGGLARDVLDLHLACCGAGVADPEALARWMVRFSFEDQDFFELDPVDYAPALGETGLAVYRREVAARSGPGEIRAPALHDPYAGYPSHAARYAAERLAVLDRDVDRLIALLGEDLSAPHQFIRVAEAMVELGRWDDALAWARRGIAETTGRQVTKLYDLAAGLLTERDDTGGVVDLRRHHHERMPSASTYAQLKDAARSAGTWGDEIDAARALLAERDPAGLVEALLADGEAEAAWAVAAGGDHELLSAAQWVRLAQAREPLVPGDAMEVYLRLGDAVLERADKRAYREAVRHLTAARRAATAAGRTEEFTARLAVVRERNRRRPSCMAMLDKADLR